MSLESAVISSDTTVSLEPTQCAVACCAEVVSAKWTLLIIRDLAKGPRYFSDLEQDLEGISPRTLCERLKLLASRGLITRTRIKGIPPRTTYQLTDIGKMLIPIIDTMRNVGEAMIAAAPLAEDIDPCADELGDV